MLNVNLLVLLTTLLIGTANGAVRRCQYYGKLKGYSPAVSFCTNSYPIVTTTTQTKKKPVVRTTTVTSTETNIVATETITSTETNTFSNFATTTITDNLQQKRATFNTVSAYNKLTNLPSAQASSACVCIGRPVTVTTTTTEQATETTRTTTTTPVTTTFVKTTTIHTHSPTVILNGATPITSVDSDGIATQDYDDEYYSFTSPFAIELYGINSTDLFVGINGWLSVSNDGSTRYTNDALPSGFLPDTCYVPFWDDLYIFQGTPQGIYYKVSGSPGSRVLAVEWFTSHFQDSDQYYHFIIRLPEANPGTATYQYYQINDSGDSATVGAQSISNDKVVQYSFNTPNITSGLVLHFDDQANTIS